ncbi:MAG TPA: 3-dehydroquinate synthase family protein [Acidimicrobiales bacterium]|nr:3-dehydroquinate synthase family protein [Acidimicrobiales bacterium]
MKKPATVSTRAASPDGTTAVHELEVGLGERSYRVLVGAGARHRLLEVLPLGARRAAVVTQDAVGVTVDAGVEQRTFLLDDGEEAKCLESVEELCRGWARWGLTRADVVVALGGGVVTDVAGFAAAVYHRGVAVVNVPTTLLGQVDAAIGGKTGVNLPEGKNLVGAFWQPAAVLCDIDTLVTLPDREYRSGLGEMAKYAFLGVEGLRDLPLEDAVAACARCKAEVVGADEREGASGRRALLNYGHTLAHALETVGDYDLRHGEAVAIGLVFAARLARRLGRIGDGRVAQHDRLIEGYGLPSRLPPGVDEEKLVTVMGRDKKVVDDGLTFVLDGAAGLAVVSGVPVADVRATLEELRT